MGKLTLHPHRLVCWKCIWMHYNFNFLAEMCGIWEMSKHANFNLLPHTCIRFRPKQWHVSPFYLKSGSKSVKVKSKWWLSCKKIYCRVPKRWAAVLQSGVQAGSTALIQHATQIYTLLLKTPFFGCCLCWSRWFSLETPLPRHTTIYYNTRPRFYP